MIVDLARSSSPPTPSRSAARSPSSAPRAASAPRRIAHNRRLVDRQRCSRATWSSPISTCPSARPTSISTRIRRRASPRRSSRPTASTRSCSTACWRKCADHLSLLAAPSMLDRTYDFDDGRLPALIDDSPSASAPLPSCSTCRMSGTTGPATCSPRPTRSCITATPDLANLRNAKNLVDMLRKLRPNDHAAAADPQPGRRAEAAGDLADGFRRAARPRADRRSSPSTPQLFGNAANNGQMIAETDPPSTRRRGLRRRRPCPHRTRGGEEAEAAQGLLRSLAPK